KFYRPSEVLLGASQHGPVDDPVGAVLPGDERLAVVEERVCDAAATVDVHDAVARTHPKGSGEMVVWTAKGMGHFAASYCLNSSSRTRKRLYTCSFVAISEREAILRPTRMRTAALSSSVLPHASMCGSFSAIHRWNT